MWFVESNAGSLAAKSRASLPAIDNDASIISELESGTWILITNIADIKNIGVGGAGTITAAAFLSNFVGDYPWVHLDIAGTAWKQRGTSQKGYIKNGATGVGVMLIVELLSNWNKYSKLK